MLLESKTAVIYGAGGAIGATVARTFAREGARVFLAGRTRAKLDEVAGEIRSAGGVAETASVDALDEQAVNTYVDTVAREAGRIDISFNLISFGDVQGLPLVEMSLEDFARPISTGVRTHFLTTRAAARHMIRRGSGVILALGGTTDPVPLLGGLRATFDAIESLRRQWACELGPYGVRVVTLKTGGVPETLPAGPHHDRRHREHLLRRAHGLLATQAGDGRRSQGQACSWSPLVWSRSRMTSRRRSSSAVERVASMPSRR